MIMISATHDDHDRSHAERCRPRYLRRRGGDALDAKETPHLGSSLSCVDIVVAAYWSALRIDLRQPWSTVRRPGLGADRCGVCSKKPPRRYRRTTARNPSAASSSHETSPPRRRESRGRRSAWLRSWSSCVPKSLSCWLARPELQRRACRATKTRPSLKLRTCHPYYSLCSYWSGISRRRARFCLIQSAVSRMASQTVSDGCQLRSLRALLLSRR